MRLGIIADTHGLLRPEVFQAFEGVDHILHAGDVGPPALLTELRVMAPVTAVYGNTDDFALRGMLPQVVTMELDGFTIGHPRRPVRLTDAGEAAHRLPAGRGDLFRHTTVLLTLVAQVVTVMNPGGAGPRRWPPPPSASWAGPGIPTGAPPRSSASIRPEPLTPLLWLLLARPRTPQVRRAAALPRQGRRGGVRCPGGPIRRWTGSAWLVRVADTVGRGHSRPPSPRRRAVEPRWWRCAACLTISGSCCAPSTAAWSIAAAPGLNLADDPDWRLGRARQRRLGVAAESADGWTVLLQLHRAFLAGAGGPAPALALLDLRRERWRTPGRRIPGPTHHGQRPPQDGCRSVTTAAGNRIPAARR
jgi:hypothetical protein